MRCVFTAAFGLLAWVSGAGAWAQVSIQDVALAESLFQKGVAEMEAGKFSDGCPKIAESQRLDPHDGTLMAMADCEDRWGHTATAVGLYENYLRNVESMAPELKKKHAARAKRAGERKKALEPLVPTMVIVLPPNLSPDAKLWRDGRALDLAAAALEIPIDPGEHKLMLQLPNGASSEKQVTINPGDHARVQLELPAAENKAPPVTESPFLPALPPPLLPLPPSLPPKKDTVVPALGGANPYRTWAYVGLGVGAAGLIAGGVLGGVVLDQQGIWEQHCDKNTKACDHEGIEAREKAGPYATGSTVGFVVGGAGVVAGAVLFVLSLRDAKDPKDTRDTKPLSAKAGVSVGVLEVGRGSVVLGARGRM